jgi:hypothetical protein
MYICSYAWQCKGLLLSFIALNWTTNACIAFIIHTTTRTGSTTTPVERIGEHSSGTFSGAVSKLGVMQRCTSSSLVLACALLGCVALQATAFVPSAQPYQTCTALITSFAAAAASKEPLVALWMSSDALDEVMCV